MNEKDRVLNKLLTWSSLALFVPGPGAAVRPRPGIQTLVFLFTTTTIYLSTSSSSCSLPWMLHRCSLTHVPDEL